MSQLIVAALVLLSTVGGLLGAAAWNRSGSPQRIVLGEGELRLPWNWDGNGEREDELALRFDWQRRDDALDARLWLPAGRLQELGFDTSIPPGAPEAADAYGRALPRLGWVVFERDGPAWLAIERQRAMRAAAGDEPRDELPSRLVPIDAGMDPGELRRRHPGANVVVLPAVFEMRYAMDPRQGPSVWGTVTRLVSPEVRVPLALRDRLSALPEPTSPRESRYEVVLGVGRLGAVWVEEVRGGAGRFGEVQGGSGRFREVHVPRVAAAHVPYAAGARVRLSLNLPEPP